MRRPQGEADHPTTAGTSRYNHTKRSFNLFSTFSPTVSSPLSHVLFPGLSNQTSQCPFSPPAPVGNEQGPCERPPEGRSGGADHRQGSQYSGVKKTSEPSSLFVLAAIDVSPTEGPTLIQSRPGAGALYT